MSTLLYYAKKLLARTLFPVPLFFEVLLLGLLLMRWKRTRRIGQVLLVMAPVGLFIASLPATGRLMLQPLEKAYPRLDTAPLAAEAHKSAPTDAPAYAVCVFGNSLDPVRGFGDDFLVRLSEAGRIAHELTQAGVGSTVIISMPGSSMSEAAKLDMARRHMAAFGLPAQLVTIVANARNTDEEMTAFDQRAQRRGLILVSSASHMPRIMRIAQGSRRPVHPAPAGYMCGDQPFTILELVPSADALQEVNRAVYERLGLIEASLH
jgi:uncharacterized SAM-binding protein YcdF (DUF218 family)